MPFDTMSEHLRRVALASLGFCKQRWGQSGLRIEQGIDASIGWRPSFHLTIGKSILAVEVEDFLYPEILKVGAHDIGHFDAPITVYQACSLEAYQADPKQSRIKLLKDHGFGILTVDDVGVVTLQHRSIPLSQHISSGVFEGQLARLPSAVRVAFVAAFDTYQSNEGQGLQQAGQIIEGLVYCLAKHSARNGVIGQPANNAGPADLIDELYATNAFRPHRAALGGARDFVREFRNTASHAPRSAKQLAEKIRKCRAGFLDALSVAHKLIDTMRAKGCAPRIHTGG